MRVALGILVIGGFILGAMLSLALPGVFGAWLVGLTRLARSDRGNSRWWVGVSATIGLCAGQLAALAVFLAAWAFDGPLQEYVVTVCWSAAALGGAAARVASARRR